MEIPRLAIEPLLAEETVFLALRARTEAGEGGPEREYRESLEAAYALRDGRSREERFRTLALDVFRRLDLDRPLREALRDFPRLSSIRRILVIKALHPREEVADLTLSTADGDRQAGVRLTPARFLEPLLLDRLIRHEFLHLEDLLTPGFGPVPPGGFSGTPALKRLRLARYREAWAASVDARLEGLALEPFEIHLQRMTLLYPPESRPELEARLHAFLEAPPTHAALQTLCEWHDGSGRTAGSPGSPCPLCRFPTFDWSDASRTEGISGAVRGDFPDWSEIQGLCGRCAERYELPCA